MTNLHNMTNILGLILCVTTSLLTFSRGGILALVLVVFVYVCTSSFAKNKNNNEFTIVWCSDLQFIE